MLFSIVLFWKIGHSANALSTAGGNVKKYNFKRASSSSSQCNDTAAKSGFNYKCAKNGGGRKFVSMAPSVSVIATSPFTDIFLGGGVVHTLQARVINNLYKQTITEIVNCISPCVLV